MHCATGQDCKTPGIHNTASGLRQDRHDSRSRASELWHTTGLLQDYDILQDHYRITTGLRHTTGSLQVYYRTMTYYRITTGLQHTIKQQNCYRNTTHDKCQNDDTTRRLYDKTTTVRLYDTQKYDKRRTTEIFLLSFSTGFLFFFGRSVSPSCGDTPRTRIYKWKVEQAVHSVSF